MVNNVFRARLGSQSLSSAETVQQNGHDVLVGRLEFDVDGTNERLTVWRNAAFETSQPLLQVSDDRGVDLLDGLVGLFYGSNADGPKQWDDLRIGTSFGAASLVRVDVGDTGQELEGGWAAWSFGAHGGTGTSQMSFDQLGGFTASIAEADGCGRRRHP